MSLGVAHKHTQYTLMWHPRPQIASGKFDHVYASQDIIARDRQSFESPGILQARPARYIGTATSGKQSYFVPD
jgi:hypothetical protein